MSFGIVEYDHKGNVICEICKKSFARAMCHVWQKHNISELEYKIKFGLDISKGICSIESSEKSRFHALKNFEIIKKNLINNGKPLKKGDKRKISEQTRIRLISQCLERKKGRIYKKINGKLT